MSDLRQDAANVLGRIKKSGQPIVITQRGRAAAVIVSIEDYERVDQQREILRRLIEGEKQIAAGRGRDLEDVLSDVDRILAK